MFIVLPIDTRTLPFNIIHFTFPSVFLPVWKQYTLGPVLCFWFCMTWTYSFSSSGTFFWEALSSGVGRGKNLDFNTTKREGKQDKLANKFTVIPIRFVVFLIRETWLWFEKPDSDSRKLILIRETWFWFEKLILIHTFRGTDSYNEKSDSDSGFKSDSHNEKSDSDSGFKSDSHNEKGDSNWWILNTVVTPSGSKRVNITL